MTACNTCAFWQPRPEIAHPGGNQAGNCRRHAPTSFAHVTSGKPITRWPLTVGDDFCGDYSFVDEGVA